MSARNFSVDVGFRVLNLLHKGVLRATRGHVGSSAFGMQVVELVTTGRTSGLPRSTILTAPVHQQNYIVLVASKGGDDRDPQWFRNLVAQPKVAIRAKGETRDMMARVATPEEAATLWPRVIAAYRPYERYGRRSRREIPLVICEPR